MKTRPSPTAHMSAAVEQCCSKTTATANVVSRTSHFIPRTAALYIGFALGMAFQYSLLELAILRGDSFQFPPAPDTTAMMMAASEAKSKDDEEGSQDEIKDIRPQGRRRTWEEVRTNLLETYKYCRMPGYVLKDKPPIYLSKGKMFGNSWRSREKKAAMKRDEDLRIDHMKRRRKTWRRLQLEGKEQSKAIEGAVPKDGGNIDDDSGWSQHSKKITYIHVGKAGGSSSSCNIRKAFPIAEKHCGTSTFPADGPSESAISRQVDCYTHYNYNMHCYHVNKSFIINTRNPVHRIMSWYLYEHLWNEPWTHPERAVQRPRCGVYMMSICFGSLDDLATVGLTGPPPPRDTKVRVGNDLTPQECSNWAWASVRGDVPATYHNVWNYDWYASRILEDDTNEIFNLRVEHNDYDWQTIDKMVGGTGNPLPDGDAPKNVAADKEELPLSDKTVSEEGVRNLCRALCEEIQVYKRLLTRAANLNEEDVMTSMEELRKTCPEETDVAPRQCGQS